MRNFLYLILIMSVASAAEPTAEQLQLMREYHLSVPPVILDVTGKDRTVGAPERIPDIANDPIFSKAIEVKPAEVVKQIILTFDLPEPVELLPKRIEPVKAQILGGVEYLDDNTFRSKVGPHSGVVVVDCYATWCPPCRVMAPIFEELSYENLDLTFKKVDVDQSPALLKEMSAYSLPTFAIYINGKLQTTWVGKTSKETLRTWALTNMHPVRFDPIQSQSAPKEILKVVPASVEIVVPIYREEYHPTHRTCGHSWR